MVVESDKADMDVESFDAGIMAAIVVNEGGVAAVGVPIAYIAETEEDLASAKEKAASAGNGAQVNIGGLHIRRHRSPASARSPKKYSTAQYNIQAECFR